MIGSRRPPVADGAERAVVEGFGARITIGKAIRRTGQAEVISLEGRFDLGDFVDPGIKDEESADRARIKALIQLSGQPADLAVFQEILPPGVDLDQLLPPEEPAQDPVELAGQIKRALEAEARQAEKTLETIRAEILKVHYANPTPTPVACLAVNRRLQTPWIGLVNAAHIWDLGQISSPTPMAIRIAVPVSGKQEWLVELLLVESDSCWIVLVEDHLFPQWLYIDQKIQQLQSPASRGSEKSV